MAGERILIVDDEPYVLDLAQRILKSKGYSVKCAHNGYEAIELARAENFDLLLTDIKMPGMSGLEIANFLQASDPGLICVTMTGFSTTDIAINAVNLGIDAFILKPFTPKELITTINRAFEKERLRRDHRRLRSLLPIFDLNKIIMNAVEGDTVSQGLLEISRQVIDADFAAICMVEGDEIAFHYRDQRENNEVRLKVSNKFIHRIFEEGQQLSFDQNRNDNEDHLAILKSVGRSFALLTPFKSRRHSFSAIFLARKAPVFSPVDAELVRVLATQASMGVEILEPRTGKIPVLFDRELLVNQVEDLRKDRARIWVDLSNKLSESESLVAQLREERNSLKTQLALLKDSSEHEIALSQLSDLTTGIVHDMRNGLGIIGNTVSFLEDDEALSTYQLDFLKISQSLDFCSLVLNNLSTLSAQDNFSPQLVDVEIIGREVYFLLERKLVNIDFVVNSNPDVPKVTADEGQLKQVFMNLMKNAGEAMPNGGTLTLELSHDGNMLVIKLGDTGQGISSRDQKRLFQKFYTTKDRGYGLGLYIVKNIIKRHNGTIMVESKLNEGTIFTVCLPVKAD